MRPLLQPDALVVLVGASGSGKTHWARARFLDTQVVSSDRCRALVSDSEDDQTVNRQAFSVFYALVRARLSLGRLTVADSTALEEHARRRLLALGREARRPVHAVVFHAPLAVLLAQDSMRGRRVPSSVIERQAAAVERLLDEARLDHEGFDSVTVLRHPYADPPPPSPAGTTQDRETGTPPGREFGGGRRRT